MPKYRVKKPCRCLEGIACIFRLVFQQNSLGQKEKLTVCPLLIKVFIHLSLSILEIEPLLLTAYSSLLGTSIGIIILLIFSALISGSEVAFFSLDDHDLKALEEEQSKPSNRILALLNRPRYLLATILIGNNFVNIAIVILSYFLMQRLLPIGTTDIWANNVLDALSFLRPIIAAPTLSYTLELLLTTGVATFVLVLFGEIAPKVYANLNKIRLAKFMSLPLLFLRQCFQLFSAVLVNGVGLVERRLEHRARTRTSKAEIDEAINLTLTEGTNTEQEADILRSIVQFSDVPVKQIMCSRVDIEAVDITSLYQDLLKIIRASGYSRIPVYKGDIDHVVGILYAKDLIGYLKENNHFQWQQLIRATVLFVPEAKKISDLLREFQSKRTHMAIVVDEYGGCEGLVTLEDIMEEIIGEIRDEFDDEIEVEYKKVSEFKYEFEGKTLINDFCRVMGIETHIFDNVRGESDSLAGMVLQLTGRFPKEEEDININGYQFQVLQLSARRIELLLITLPKTE
ncbi:MAG: gliding motility-associated protein GldE [Bacteroidota bacterium]